MAAALELTVCSLADAREAAHRAAALCPHVIWLEMALLELLVNAVEHGNLGIGNAEKARLRAAGEWEAEVEHRLSLPQYATRSARLTALRQGAAWCFEIVDQGDGFDWRPWLDFDAGRVAAPCGRGIALARQLALPDLIYVGCGNRVKCSVPDV